VQRTQLVAQFCDKLDDEEMLTLATFLESSVGQKLVNKTISLAPDKERANRDMKEIFDARKTDLVGVMVRVMEKYGISMN
jgi:hypothetical protein